MLAPTYIYPNLFIDSGIPFLFWLSFFPCSHLHSHRFCHHHPHRPIATTAASAAVESVVRKGRK